MAYFPRGHYSRGFFSKFFGPTGLGGALEALKQAFFDFWW